MKRIIIAILTLAFIFTSSTVAFAAEHSRVLPEAASAEISETLFSNNGTISASFSEETRSTSLPTKFWSLPKTNYSADLQIVGRNWLYTNYYYHPNGDGEIYVYYDVRADKSTTVLYIGLYDLTKGKLVVEFVVDDVRTSGKTGGMYFYNLIQSHNYAVCFRAHPSSLHGSAVICH